ncbi:MAG: hypothetical protein IT514_09330 [Burkholderiales bacterium]|nr:hypothetical protein [Burkholderiales bacterium]
MSFQANPLRLLGSRDPGTGVACYPPRQFAVDGSLRPCEPVELSTTGVLYAWTEFAQVAYGQVDLPEGPRILTRLAPGVHEIGASYVLEADPEQGWRFRRA